MICTVFLLIRVPSLIAAPPQKKTFNPFPHDRILDQTKLKAFADDKLNVTKMIISGFDRVENIVGKEKLLVQAISPFPTMFLKDFFPRGVKRCHCVGMG